MCTPLQKKSSTELHGCGFYHAVLVISKQPYKCHEIPLLLNYVCDIHFKTISAHCRPARNAKNTISSCRFPRPTQSQKLVVTHSQ